MHTILYRHIPSHAWPPFYMILSCFPLNVKLFPVHFNNIFSMPLIFFFYYFFYFIPSDSLAALNAASFLFITSLWKERKRASWRFRCLFSLSLWISHFVKKKKQIHRDCCVQYTSQWQREKQCNYNAQIESNAVIILRITEHICSYPLCSCFVVFFC